MRPRIVFMVPLRSRGGGQARQARLSTYNNHRIVTPLVVYTVGHSTRSFEELVRLLREFGVRRVVDVRSFPAGKRQPHFGRKHLERALPDAGIDYVHLPALGGYRKPRADSQNRAWKSAGFRGYADHMETPEFLAGAAELLRLAAETPTAVMCAEAHWSRCHRQLLSDWLLAQGAEVRHILGPGRSELHRPTPFVRLEGGRVSYPALV